MPIICVAAAALAGIGIPLVAAGPAAAGVALTLALLLMLVAPGRFDLLTDVLRSARSPLGVAVAALLVLWLPSVVDSLDATRSLMVWARMMVFMAAAALLFHFLRRSPIAGNVCLRALVVSSLLCIVVALLGIYVATPIYAVFRGKLETQAEAAYLLKYYGSAVACLVPVVLWAGFRLGNRWRAAGLAYVAMGVALIFAVGSNAGLFGLVIGCMVGAATIGIWRPRRAWTALAVWGALVASALSVTLARLPALPPGELLAEKGLSDVGDAVFPTWALDAHRQSIWAFGRDRFLEAPITGHGIDVANYLPGADVQGFWLGAQHIMPGHPHNWFLEVLMETGLLGAAGVIVVLVLLVRSLARTLKDRWSAGAAFALFAAFWSSSFFNFSVWASWWHLSFLVLTAIVAGTARQPKSEAEHI